MRYLSTCAAVVILFGLMSLGGGAQTVTILNAGAAAGSTPEKKLVRITLSIANSKKVPILVDNSFFLLDKYETLSRLDNSDVSFHADLQPGIQVNESLWFEVPAALDVMTTTLSTHRRDSNNWDDYLHIHLAFVVPATAPMWHLAHPGDVPDALSYGNLGMNAPRGEVTPPRLVYAPDPVLPAEARRKMRGGSATVVVTLIVDTAGNPHQLEIVSRPIGMGLEAEALRAAGQYRFKPALDKAGHALAVEVMIQVKFRD